MTQTARGTQGWTVDRFGQITERGPVAYFPRPCSITTWIKRMTGKAR
jgi:hypothetical protein